jgi:hypothetical protein
MARKLIAILVVLLLVSSLAEGKKKGGKDRVKAREREGRHKEKE